MASACRDRSPYRRCQANNPRSTYSPDWLAGWPGQKVLDTIYVLCYNAYMEHKYVTMRVWAETRKTLRLIAAMKDKSIIEVLHELASQELARLRET